MNIPGAILLICLCLASQAFVIPTYAGNSPRLRIALFVDDGASPSEFKKEIRGRDDILWKSIDGDDIADGALDNFDALLVPGGAARAEANSMGPEAREAVRNFVKGGGIYMGICAGAYLASQARDVYLGMLPLKTLDQENWYRVVDGTYVDLELTPLGMEIFGIDRSNLRIIYENGPIFAPPAVQPPPGFTPLGFFRSEVVANGGERGVMLGAPAMILSKYGRGAVLAISPHPEETPGMKNAEVHALHWLYDHRDISAPAAKDKAPTDSTKLSAEAVKLAESIFNRAEDVSYIHKDAPAARQVMIGDDGTVKARTDCSGFISYIVNAIAPSHYDVVSAREPQDSYPQAMIWARFFDALDTDRPYYGWLGVKNWRDLRAGDIIAWVKGESASKSNHNTGHVMLVVGRPSEPRQANGYRYIEVPVIDSSTTYHFQPERLPPNAHQEHRDGLGMGSVRIILSATDEPIGYWAGTYWGEGQEDVTSPTMSDVVRFGRMVSNLH